MESENIMEKKVEEVKIENGCIYFFGQAYEKDILYVLCPYGIGDTLYMAALMKSYKECTGEKRKICFIVKDNHHEIPTWFREIDQVLADTNLVNQLNQWVIFNQLWELDNFIYGHFKKSREGALDTVSFASVEKKNMIERYRSLVLKGLIPENPILGEMHIDYSARESLLKKYAIDRKTIILMPYAVSCQRWMTASFWITLADLLSRAGFRLYTNVKDETEVPIPGTIPLVGSLNDVAVLSGECLAVIALRSGICDVLAFVQTLLFIINTSRYHYNEWNVEYAVDREGIMNILCEQEEDEEAVLKELCYIFEIDR